jgi:hypothetical protein
MSSCVLEFSEACSRGDLAGAQRALATCRQASLDARADPIKELSMACRHGFLDLARWLAAEFGLTAADTRSPHGGGAFQEACRSGHLDIAKWLVETFAPTADDVRDALCWACHNGHASVYHWLVETFHLTADDASSAFTTACANGRLENAKWLADTLALSMDDVRAENNNALSVACEGGHLETLQWLVARFGLTADDANEAGAFVASCGSGRLEATQRLVATFGGPDFPDPRAVLEFSFCESDVSAALRVACGRGHTETLQWLVDTYGLPSVAMRENLIRVAEFAERGSRDRISRMIETLAGASLAADWPARIDRTRPPPAKIFHPGCGAPCVVCLDAPPACVFAPCGHACACAACAQRVGKTCPVCRARVRSAQPWRADPPASSPSSAALQ